MCVFVLLKAGACRERKRETRGRGSHKAAGTCLGCPLEMFCILLIRTQVALRLPEHGRRGCAGVRLPRPLRCHLSPPHTHASFLSSHSLPPEDQGMSFPVNFSSFSDFPNPHQQASLMLGPSQAELYCFLSSCMIRHMCCE